MATKATKVTMQKGGKGKSKRALVIEMLRKKPLTVDEICRKTGISPVHARSILFLLKDVKKEEGLTKYSLPSSK